MSIIEEVKAVHRDIIKWRRDLHQIPEIGFELEQTSRYIKDRLDEMGIIYRTAAKTGIVALIKGEKPGPTLALRADMDGLPVIEKTGLPFASTNGNMHACGHDAHMAMLLGAAKIINNCRFELSGNIKLLFQPAEEGHFGAKQMIADGCLENPPVDAAVGLHVGQIFPEVRAGQIGICKGPILAAANQFHVTVKGESTHGALPHLGVDAISVAAEMLLNLQKIVSREINPLNPAVLTVGKISGGEALNIVSSKVTFSGDFRSIIEGDREFITERFENICRSVAEANRAEVEIDILEGYPPTINDSRVTDMVIDAASKIIGREAIIEIEKPNMGTEDMSFYLEKVAGAFFVLGTGNEDKGITFPHHNARFDVDEDVLWIGPAIFVRLALDYLAS